MGDWIETFNSVFWITAGTMTFGFLAVVLKTALASKCDDLNLCWGCIKIHRRVDLEQNEGGIAPSSSQRQEQPFCALRPPITDPITEEGRSPPITWGS